MTLDVPAKTYEPGKPGAQRAFDYAALGTAVDEFRVMAYNWSWSGGAPGPIAPYWWVRQVLEFTKTQVDPAKIMLGVPLYGYNWPARGGRSSSLTGDTVSQLLATYNPVIHWDKSNREHWFTFVSKQTRKKRIVWFSDRDSVAERRQLAQEMGIRGIAVWALGKEDQAIWSSLNP